MHVLIQNTAVDVAITSGQCDSISEQSQESGPVPDPSQNEMVSDKSGHGIQPSHIREALRRLSVATLWTSFHPSSEFFCTCVI